MDINNRFHQKHGQAASHDVTLVLMPLGMSKRLLNTTHYRPKTDLILWRLHMVFIINNSYQPPMLLRPEGQNSNGQGQGDTAMFSTISITGALKISPDKYDI
jgi:hypothetical protein